MTQTQGIEEAEEEGGARRLHRTQVYALPGFNIHPLPGSTIGVGVELPVTPARTFDYAVRTLFTWEF